MIKLGEYASLDIVGDKLVVDGMYDKDGASVKLEVGISAVELLQKLADGVSAAWEKEAISLAIAGIKAYEASQAPAPAVQ